MSAATLATIELALYTALAGLLTNVTTGPTTSRPFACVGRYAGPVPPEGLAEAAAQYPCAMLRFDEDLSTRDVMGYGAASIEDRALSQFSVLVAVEDARAIDDGMVGDASAPGLLRLVDAVIAACNGLVVADTHMNLSTRYAGTRAELIRRGAVYVYAVRFEATRDAEAATYDASAAVTIPAVYSDINLVGTGTAPNPLVQIVSDTTP